MTAAFSEAVGPRLAREVSLRGKLRDGRLLVVVSSALWATQVTEIESEVLRKLRARLGAACASGLSIHVGPVEP
jgi:predicted nucleic acid-binding Zn ribbon protein